MNLTSVTAQTRKKRIFTIGIASLGVALGFWEAYRCASIRFGYVAAYSFASAIGIGILLLVIGLGLAVFRRTRPAGIGIVTAGLLSVAMFYGGIAILIKLDKVAWKHEPPLQSFGPDQKASVVVYFKKGTTDDEIESFRVLMLDPKSAGTYLRLTPNQANGFDAVALTFSSGTPARDGDYVESLRRDRRVQHVYENIAPSEISLSPTETSQPPSNSER